MTPEKDSPQLRDQQGKRWDKTRTPAGPGAFGAPTTGEAEAAEGPIESGNTELEFARRSALAVREQFGSEVIEIVQFRGEWTVTVKPERILDIMKFLRDTWNYRMCHDVTSVDLYPEEPRFMVVYHLLNLETATRFRVKAPVSGEKPEIDSVVPIWTGADFTEREVYDLMGITFRGHPDLRRILMMEDYQHHPLRKDFPLTGFPLGIDTLKDE